MDQSFSIAEARDHLARIVHAVEKGKPAKLTRRGKPVAMLVSLADYERIQNGKGGLFESMMAWRKKYHIDKEGIGPEFLEGLRDPSPGREVNL